MQRKQRLRKSKAAPLLEWQTDADENKVEHKDENADWWQARQSAANSDEPGSPSAQKLRGLLRRWGFVFVALALLTSVFGWMWYRAEKGVAQIEAELRERVEVDLWRGTQANKATTLIPTTAEAAPLHPLTSTLQMLALTGEGAVVRLVLQPGPNQPALRQTLVYQRTGLGWQRIAPTRGLWGSSRHLQTRYFDFHYYALDEEAVRGAASIVDDFYASVSPDLLAALQTSMQAAVRIQVEVEPSKSYGSIAKRESPTAALVVASPATYLASVEIGQADLLAQAVLLSLLSESAAQRAEARWQPFVDALLLWQLWKVDLPLSAWREPLVKWVLAALENPQAQSSIGEPAFTLELCALFQLWMVSPSEVKIPVFCDNHIWAEGYLTSWRATYQPPLTLAQLVPGVPRPKDYTLPLEYAYSPVHPGAAVLLTTVIDYVVTTYGEEQLALLVTKLPNHQSWETLVPAVFDISLAEFTRGWRGFVAERY